MKKFITLLLVLTGMVLTASATDYYVIGDPAGGWVGNPITANKALKMNTSDNETYYYDITPTSDQTFAIVDGEGSSASDWSGLQAHRFATDSNPYVVYGNEYGISVSKNKDNSFKVSGGSSTYRIVFNASTLKLSFVKHETYVVAGCYNTDDNASFFGTAWDNNSSSNVMTLQDDGTYVKSYSNVQLTTTGTIKFKIVKKGAWSPGSSTNIEETVSSAYTYNIKFQVWVNNFNGAVCTKEDVAITSYYVVGGLDNGTDWTVAASPMSESAGVYSQTLTTPATSSYDYRFAIAPNTVISGSTVFNWSRIIRPYQGSSTDKILEFSNIENYSTTTNDSEGDAWQLPQSLYKCSLTFSYNAGTYKYSVSPYVTATLNANGYGTFGTQAGNFIIPATDTEDNAVKAYYAASASDKLISMNVLTAGTGVNKTEGLFLIGTPSKTVKFTPAGSYVAAVNLLKPGDGTTSLVSSDGNYYYVFSGDAFKKLVTSTVVPEGKAYLYTTTPLANELTFSFDDGETTSIRVINTDDVTVNSNETFNVAGQRVVNPTKGLYIVNGKKVMVK